MNQETQTVTFSIVKPRMGVILKAVAGIVLLGVVGIVGFNLGGSDHDDHAGHQDVTVLGADGTITQAADPAKATETAPVVPEAPVAEATTPAPVSEPAVNTDGLYSSVTIMRDFFSKEILADIQAANLPITNVKDVTSVCPDRIGCVEAASSDQVSVYQFATVDAARPFTEDFATNSVLPKSSYQIGSVVITFSETVDERLREWYRSTAEKVLSGQKVTPHPKG